MGTSYTWGMGKDEAGFASGKKFLTFFAFDKQLKN